jgi:DNA-binding transcriptional LysR family regulator
MNFRQLQTLVAVADAGGFTAAAGRLHLSQPAATRQIQSLETELGVRLFDRVGRRLHLTSEGDDIVRRGRRLLQEAESLRDRASALKNGSIGTLRVGASPQNIETVLAPFAAGFRKRHPGIEVHFVEDGGLRVGNRLDDGDVHVALTTVSDEQHFGRLLFPCCAVAVVAKSYPLARRTTVDVAALADEPLLLLQRSFATRSWLEAACHHADIRPHVALESAAPATLMALAASGDGIAIVPSNVNIPREGVKAVPVTYRSTPIGRWIIAAWDRRRFLPPFARTFVDHLAAHVRRGHTGRDVMKRLPPLPKPELTQG